MFVLKEQVCHTGYDEDKRGILNFKLFFLTFESIKILGGRIAKKMVLRWIGEVVIFEIINTRKVVGNWIVKTTIKGTVYYEA